MLNFVLFLNFPGKLFQRVVLMSGSALAPWAVVRDPARATLKVASTLNCTEEQLERKRKEQVRIVIDAPIGLGDFRKQVLLQGK